MDFLDVVVARVIGIEVDLFHAYARVVSETDAEALHDFRIGQRRLRSLLKTLGMKSISADLEKATSAVGKMTTPVRDLEVMAEELERHGLIELAQLRRLKVSYWYKTADENPLIRGLFTELADWPDTFRREIGYIHIRHLKKRTTRGISRQLQRLSLALSDPAHDRHDIRLRIKHARYSQEAYPELYPLPGHLLSELKQLQSSLGSWHDCHQWCLKAKVEPDLEALIATWSQAKSEALQAAEQRITPLAVELAKFLEIKAT